jgi:CRP-like cAMP-binding protein
VAFLKELHQDQDAAEKGDTLFLGTKKEVKKKQESRDDLLKKTSEPPTIKVTNGVPTDIIETLHLTSFQRTKEQSKALFSYLRGLKAFKDLSDFILSELCSVFKLHFLEPAKLVFKQGEVGTAWFIILAGSCKVLINKTGRVEDSVHVATMPEGAGFGDLALVNDKPRTATIAAATDVTLISVEKTDYNRILKVIHITEQREKLLFLKNFKLFDDWEEYKIKPTASLLKWTTYAPGQVIIEEGAPIKSFYFLRTGVVYQTRKLTLRSGQTVLVRVAPIKENEYFGHEGVLDETVIHLTRQYHCHQ